MPEDYDILRYLIMPLITIGLHWQLYKMKSKYPDHKEAGKDWDAVLMLMWTVATLYSNFMLFL